MERARIPTLDEMRQRQLAEDVAAGAGLLRALFADAARSKARLSAPVRERLAGLLALLERCERNAQSKGDTNAEE